MHRVVPQIVVENYRAGRYHGDFSAVGIFLDLSGFSSMTDTLMQHGQHGAEVLANMMHGVFDPLVETIFNYGGKIVSFAGDGVMALFPIEGNPHDTAIRAVTSAWTIQRGLFENPVRQTVYGNFHFSVKIGITVGDVSWGILRSLDGRKATYFFRGSAVDNSANAEHEARAGEILLTETIYALLKNEIEVAPFASYFHLGGFLVPMPEPVPDVFQPIDLEISKLFMPEDVIAQNISGEFRQVVNLFMRVPNLSYEEIQSFMQIAFDLHEKYGGLINRLDFGDKGCNMLMLWGAPVAYENDIRRALDFVLELKAKVDFPVAAGLTYYVAHAGYLGSTICEDYTCYGWGINLAARFMMNAPGGGIWIDERIARRVKNNFEFEYLGSQRFKGFAAEQKVYALTGRKAQELFHQGEFVGREIELPRLMDFIKPLRDGRFAGVFVVWGDAGIGKSRLINELKNTFTLRNRPILWAICHPDQILRNSFNPFHYWLLRYFGIHSSMEESARLLAFHTKLDDLIKQTNDAALAVELDRTRSVLAALIDLLWSDSLYEKLDAEGRYNNTLLALIALLKAESLRQPVVLSIDDAQFLDDDSIAFLPRLKRSLTSGMVSYPVAIIVSSRPMSSGILKDETLVDSSLELGALSTQSLSGLAEIYLGGTASPELIRLLTERSEGNPFFAEQILIYLQEESLLEMGPKGWRIIQRLHESSLPTDIRALLIARLDQLTRAVRDVIQTASVLGREFEVQILSGMLTDYQNLEEGIDDAEKAGIWVPLSQIRYIFSHGLLRDAAYSMQLNARRQELHSLAVVAMENVYGAELGHHYGEVAYHAERANMDTKALHYLTLAGKLAANTYQNTQAIDYFTRALAIVPADETRNRFDLLMERVSIFNRVGNRELQLNDLTILDNLAEEMDQENCRSRVLVQRTTYAFVMGDYPSTISYAEKAVAKLQAVNDHGSAVGMYILWAQALFRSGNLDEAMKRAEIGIELARQVGDRPEEGRISSTMGLIALEQKEPSRAQSYLENAVKIGREVGNRRLEVLALNNLANFAVYVQRDFVLAREYFEQSYALGRELGDLYDDGVSLSNLGWVIALQGDFSTARKYYEQALYISREVGNVYQEAYTLMNLSVVSELQNKPAEAVQCAKSANALVNKIGDKSGEAWSQLFLGQALLLDQDLEGAKAAFQSSVQIREELGQPALAAEPLAGLIRVAFMQDDGASAVTLADRILGYLSDGGTLEGTEDPLRVFYACYTVLEKEKDPRTQVILQTAVQMLEAQVSKFRDEDSRRLYIESVPWRHALWNTRPVS